MRFSLAGAMLLALAMALPQATVAAEPASRSVASALPPKAGWLGTVRRTGEGAIVVGNPAARVKLVEYLSMTCPHCAHLAGEVIPRLKQDYIARGLVSLEVRHAVRDGHDFVASLLLRCEPPARYLESMEALFAIQPDWMAKGANAKTVPGFEEMSPDEKFATVARSAGFDGFFAGRGMNPKAFAACLADSKGQEQLTRMTENSWGRDAIPGTPLILINGVRQKRIDHWSDLEPLIRAALDQGVTP